MQPAAKITNLDLIKGAIAAKMDSAVYTSWIAPTEFAVVDGMLVMTAQNKFSADFINGTHLGTLSDVAREFGLSVRVVARGAAPVNDNNIQMYVPAPSPTPASSGAFDAFVVSDENSFVVSAAKKVASGAVTFSPLFIYGPAGCGKSMLAGCIAAAAPRVVSFTGAQFVAEFTRALATRNIFAFKDFCRNCDTFIMDDIQALAGKRATMDEFLQLVSDLRMAGKNIVLTSHTAPNALAGFDRRLQAVLASGLVADMAAPDAGVRRAMLVRGGVAADVADAIAPRVAANGHMISGIITKVRAYTELMGAALDVDAACRLLSDTLTRARTPMSMVRDMCDKLGVAYDAVCGAGRCRALVLARQMMMAVLKGSTNLSLAEIGQYVGGRDHATVVYAINQIEKLKKCDLVLSAQIAQMISEYRN